MGNSDGRLYLSPPNVGEDERAALLRAFDSGWVAPLGPDVDAFEAELQAVTGAAHVVALSSGTAALHLALLMAGIGPGDEVLVPSLTFAATANAVHYVGARPVFIDSDPGTWTIDVTLVAEHLERGARTGTLPGAVIPVDVFGQCADYDALAEVCRPHGVPLISDAAEAIGASYKGRPAGGLTSLGALSFNGNKMITTSGGGALTTSSPELAARAGYLATQAREAAAHYEHREVGYNYRLSNLLAALGRAQLARLDEFLARRREIRELYRKELSGFGGVGFMPEADYGASNAWLTVLTLDPQLSASDPTAVRLALAAADIEARPVWKPMHLQPVHEGFSAVDRGVSAHIFATSLCLPSGAGMSHADQIRVVEIIADLLAPAGTR